MQVLRLHRRRQQRQRERRDNAAKPCLPSGYVFTRPDGAPFHPLYFTQRFRLLLDRAGLPPVRLHDLRHGTASLAHAAGADLRTIQDLLGHANVTLTADVYTNVLPAAQRKEAEATARLILGVAERPRIHPNSKRTTQRPRRPAAGPQPDAAQSPATSRTRAARNTRRTRSLAR